jgi:hypothetical protein
MSLTFRLSLENLLHISILSLTLGFTVSLSKTYINRPPWRRQAVNPIVEPPQQNPRKSSLLGLYIYFFSSALNMILIIAN